MTKYNPEKRAWKGRSYKKGGKLVRDLRGVEIEKVEIYTPCHHPCKNCSQVDCMCAAGDGRFKRCSRKCNSYGNAVLPIKLVKDIAPLKTELEYLEARIEALAVRYDKQDRNDNLFGGTGMAGQLRSLVTGFWPNGMPRFDTDFGPVCH